MFNYRKFLLQGFLDAVGKQADYMIIQNASGYFDKGVLTEADLAEISAKIDEKNNPEVITAEDEETAEVAK